ncbi:amiloride-sensitive sodium channel domain-containing protein [Ditylenchus destructor]|uniref:Amiloride-sensitive sodium channel domain-containing protein n=1 Tax=Ditylenchus destructor TaxID=166010 RepID=A0AAD4MVT0_9BILA|nr:amiloride-sensitive sodium channel domain-containing protein [Ditylenchus destructor]
MELNEFVGTSYDHFSTSSAIHVGRRPSLYNSRYDINNRADSLISSHAYLAGARKKCTCRFLWNYELHGLTAYLKAKTVGGRLLWSFTIAICIFLAATTTQTMFSDYLEHQTATLVTVRQRPEMKLPSIIICPKNPDALNYPKILRDMGKRLPHLDRVTLGRLLAFVIAGAGFSNVNEVLHQVSPNEMQRLSAMYRRWKGNRTLADFYTTLIEKNGYTCDELFQECHYGYQKLNCCDIVRPYYVMLRGRCFRIDNFTQTDPDVLGKLSISMNQLHSRLSERSGLQPQVIAYISDKYPDVATFPRFYLNFHMPIYVRVRARRMVLLPWNNQCTTLPQYKGKACYVIKWLELKVIKPLNCTVYYLRHKIPGYPVCDPETIVKNYKTVTNVSMIGYNERCLPQCHRFDHRIRAFHSDLIPYSIKKPLPAFRLEMSYVDLEIERYEEVLTTSLPGFVSQLGGQSGLFIGVSACTIIQILLALTKITYNFVCGLPISHDMFL